MKTYQPKQKEVKRTWHLINARGKVLGRMASEVAILLMGKHKPTYSSHMDSGDSVVVLNAKDVVLTGNKKFYKSYQSHSGYPGGFKEVSFEKMFEKFPERVVKFAVSGMLPDNRLKSIRLRRLHINKGEKHNYENKFKK